MRLARSRLLGLISAFALMLGIVPVVASPVHAAAPIVTLVGDLQSKLGCAGDWDPACSATDLQDPDGDGVYVLETTALPAGNYQAKVALDRSWTVNYGAGGVQGGDNIAFSVAAAGQKARFAWNATSHVLDVSVTGTVASHDDNIWWDGLKHDSRDTLYRTPSGAVPAGTPVTLRLRTFHGDVTSVTLRLYSLNAGGQQLLPMTVAAANVSCYDPALASSTCDFWEYTIPGDHPADNLWYRFIVSDGSDTDYYADDTAALDGGLGRTTDDAVDQSWALMLSVPGFTSPAWARNAMVYQIFPDRFRNGRANNDPATGDVRYDDPVLKLGWNTQPEGYCRNYEGATPQTCPWRYPAVPEWGVGKTETPRGRDYFAGDIKGVDQQLDYLKTLGINTIYFNPIFDAGSNHGYDTQDYKKIDPYFGTSKDFDNLLKHARQLGVRIVLDGVFNHMSSDSPFFDRYSHYPTVGACESMDSPYRSWFSFKPQADGPCVGPDGPRTMAYEGWYGFDSIPVLTKSNAEVQAYFLTAPDSVSKLWLQAGTNGWRLDVSSDPSFPDGYWEKFRTATKSVKSDSLSIAESWQKDSILLRSLRGDRLDTTMNYRLRDAVLGLLAPQGFDSKGFADSGRQLKPSEFLNRLASVREDYPDAAYYSLLNILDSHDTERALWTLTAGPNGTARNTPTAADRERLKLASLIQFTQAGMPTIYYGDEVGVTGADDPDDRRVFPWLDQGGQPNLSLFAWYALLTRTRASDPALTQGDFKVLLADDANRTAAYGRKTATDGGVVVLNVSNAEKTLTVGVTDYLPNGVRLMQRYGTARTTPLIATVTNGAITVKLPAMSGAYLATGRTDLAGPKAPVVKVVSEGPGTVHLSWNANRDAVAYRVYASPLAGGGWVPVTSAPVTGTQYTVTGLTNAQSYHFLVRGIDRAGNLGDASADVTAVPHAGITWANLQWPPTLSWTMAAGSRTDAVYGQVYADGITNAAGQGAGVVAQAGYGPRGSAPSAAGWTWINASFNADKGNNDEYTASFAPQAAGTFDYLFRYSVTSGREWVYGDQSGVIDGTKPAPQPGVLTVAAASDTTPPDVPSGLKVGSSAPTAVELAWDAVTDPGLSGYEIGRRPAGSADAFAVIGTVTTLSYVDRTVAEGSSYAYAVRAVDTALNRSAWSAAVTTTAAARTVSVKFIVTVPDTTDATGLKVDMAGFLDRLDGGLPQWDPSKTALTRVDATHWTITLTGKEGTQIEYKYALQSWERVEKDASCAEVGNRQLTLAWGANGQQVVADTVANWRGVGSCPA